VAYSQQEEDDELLQVTHQWLEFVGSALPGSYCMSGSWTRPHTAATTIATTIAAATAAWLISFAGEPR
jgi:hypothetical protein